MVAKMGAKMVARWGAKVEASITGMFSPWQCQLVFPLGPPAAAGAVEDEAGGGEAEQQRPARRHKDEAVPRYQPRHRGRGRTALSRKVTLGGEEGWEEEKWGGCRCEGVY